MKFPDIFGDSVIGQHVRTDWAWLNPSRQMVGTSPMFNSLAACTLPWPAMIVPPPLISIGFRKPKASILSLSFLI
jgi:hypothetical protein